MIFLASRLELHKAEKEDLYYKEEMDRIKAEMIASGVNKLAFSKTHFMADLNLHK